jgi:hypothetical protein
LSGSPALSRAAGCSKGVAGAPAIAAHRSWAGRVDLDRIHHDRAGPSWCCPSWSKPRQSRPTDRPASVPMWPSWPGCCPTLPRPAGRSGCGSSCAANDHTPAPSCPTPTSTAGGSRPSPPTHRSSSSPRWRHATACDLIAWAQTILLHGELARCEPKTLRYRLLHVAASITRGQRRTRSSRHQHAGTIRTPPNQIPGGNPTNKIINSALWPLLKGRG